MLYSAVHRNLRAIGANHISLLSALLLSIPASLLASIHYVDDDASPGGDGQTWETAYDTIQEAVDAGSGGVGGEVWVAAGTYTDTDDYVVVMMYEVDLYGGFAGTETAREQRDWEANQTIIDGQDARRCVFGEDNATLDGFIVTNGKGDQKGGGLYIDTASPVIANCSFIGNTAYSSNNRCYGGGIYNKGSNPTITNCLFQENTVDSGTMGYGGGFYNDDSSPVITGCRFFDNDASGGGGGGLYNFGSSEPIVTNCVFIGNTAKVAGGTYCSSSDAVYMNCTFSGNTATNSGGTIYNYSSTPTMTNCILWGNGTEVGGDPPNITFSCIEGGLAGDGNTDQDPLFADAENGDLTLLSESPCIDTGTSDGAPATDIIGNPRPMGAGIDMGAYEDQSSPTPTPTPTPTPSPTPYDGRAYGDLNNDQCTNIDDFLLLLDNWQIEYGGEVVDLDDFLNMLDYWQLGEGC